MHGRSAFLTSLVSMGLLCLVPTSVLGQSAFLPERGEVSVSMNYQWFDSNEHLLTGAVTGPTLTPLETSLGLDFQTKVTDDLFPQGRTTTQMVFVDAEVGITDRFALSGGFAGGAPRYVGPVPTATTDEQSVAP